MTQETRFSRIAVTADDDDDFVIEAGATQPIAQAPVEPAAELDPVPAAELDSEPAAMPEPAVTLKPAPAAEQFDAPASARRSTEAYETTLEDLDSVSMSGVQKAVIAIAILAVVAFVAFQFLA